MAAASPPAPPSHPDDTIIPPAAPPESDPDATIRSFVSSQKALLLLELRSEEDEEASASASASGGASSSKKGNPNGDEEERPQNVLRNLRVDGISVGLYGRTVAEFVVAAQAARSPSNNAAVGGAGGDGVGGGAADAGASSAGAASGEGGGGRRGGGGGPALLPAHRLTVGDEVEILSKTTTSRGSDCGRGSSGRSVRSPGGVICAVTETEVSVALFDRRRGRGGGGGGSGRGSKHAGNGEDDGDEDDALLGPSPLSLVPRSSADVHRKMIAALDELERHGVGHPVAGSVVRAAFCPPPPPRTAEAGEDAETSAEDRSAAAGENEQQRRSGPAGGLDASQLDAVHFCLPPAGGAATAAGTAASSPGVSSTAGFVPNHAGADCVDRPLALIHGPPGTGKTTTVVELIRRAVHDHGWKVLVTAPSNVAVDNVLEKLVAAEETEEASEGRRRGRKGRSARSDHRRRRLRAVRLGHPARIRPAILRYSLESLVRGSDGADVVDDVRAELTSYVKVLSDPKSRGSDRRTARREVKLLRSELRRREEAVVGEVVSTADVVLATNVGAASSVLDKCFGGDGRGGGAAAAAAAAGPGRGRPFDLVVVDEAAQSLEASCWIPALRGRRLVLAGDHRQLPPTVKSRDGSVRRGLGRTMFERIMGLYGDDVCGGGDDGGNGRKSGLVSRMLRVQYRMNSDIADWASGATYGGALVSHGTVKGHRLTDLPGVADASSGGGRSAKFGDGNGNGGAPTATDLESTLILIDTAGCDMRERVNAAGSRYNEGEAGIVAKHVTSLLRAGIRPEEIAVISPYNGQVELLRSILLPNVPTLEIRSVDGFQGGEREAVVISLVRSSDGWGSGGGGGLGTIGFLRDERRLNVAVTRARRQCCVVCDTDTVTRSDFIRDLVAWMEQRGDYRSAMEFVEGDPVRGVTSGASLALAVQASQRPKDAAKSEQVASSLAVTKGKDNETEQSKSLPPSSTKTGAIAHTERGGGAEPLHARARKPTPDEAKAERRRELMDKIGNFAERGKEGDEMTLSAGLSKFDRLVVHELAEQLGLGHRSVGTEGIDRRIIVTVTREVGSGSTQQTKEAAGETAPKDSLAPASAFVALDVGDTSDSECSKNDDVLASFENSVPATSSNALLGSLAKERMERQRQQQQQQQEQQQFSKSAPKSVNKSKKKKKKNSGEKIGGNVETRSFENAKETASGDDLDDMAFLDAQIEKVQTSHGRKVEGSGKAYKSIINGVLLAKPTPPEPKRDARASAALKAKLKNAEDGRKSKGGKKKKKK